MADCLFCKISKGDIPSSKVYEDDLIYAFYDINPAAKSHIIVIPKEHIASAHDIDEHNADIIKEIFKVIPKIAADQQLENGYRVITNVGEFGQQSVKHLHFHIIGGEQLKWELI